MLRRGPWFSARVRIVVLIEGSGAVHYDDSVFVFKSRNWNTAKTRALELGRSLETTYRNRDGEEVQLRPRTWCTAEGNAAD